MTRVLHVITGTGAGGAERALLRLLRGLRGRYEFAVVSLKAEGALAPGMREAGAQVVSLGMRGPAGLAQLRALAALRGEVRRFRPGLVHAWLFQANLLARLAAGRTPDISSLRVEERERPWEPYLDAATSPLVTRYTAVCESVACFAAARGVPLAKIAVIPNGLAPEEFEEPAGWRGFRARHAIPEEAFLLLCVGRLAPQKGQHFLLRAMEGLEREAGLPAPEGVWLLLVGDGPDRPALEREAALARLSGRVRFLPHLDDVRPAYRAADLLVLPSLWEGMPNAVLEAMAQGCPVAATHVGGTPEVVEQGRSGLLVPPADPLALRRVLAGLLRDPGLRARLASEGRARAEREFGIGRTLERTETLYRDLLV